MERCDAFFLAALDDKDKGHFGQLFARERKRLHAVETIRRAVGEDQVDLRQAESFEEFFLRLRVRDGALVAVALQLGAHHRGVGGAGFKMDDLQRRHVVEWRRRQPGRAPLFHQPSNLGQQPAACRQGIPSSVAISGGPWIPGSWDCRYVRS